MSPSAELYPGLRAFFIFSIYLGVGTSGGTWDNSSLSVQVTLCDTGGMELGVPVVLQRLSSALVSWLLFSLGPQT